MNKRYLIVILMLFIVTVSFSSAYAVPDKGSAVDIYVWPRYWQWEEAKTKNNGDWSWANDYYAGKWWQPWKRFYIHGCLVTSLSMLFNYYGLSFIPDKQHYTELCSNTEFSSWCASKGKLYSETDPGNLNRWLTDNNVYQQKWLIFDLLLPEEVVRLFWRYRDQWGGKWAIRPNFSCYLLSTGEGCYKIDWTNPMAEQLLDYDLKQKMPAIMKIKWTDKYGVPHPNHFVLIGGYSWDTPGYEDYRAYDPNQPYYRYATYPPSLKELYKKDPNNPYDQTSHEKLRVDRYTGESFYFEWFWQHVVTLLGFSPIEMQVISPDGKTTGYDPTTGTRVINIPRTSYSEESEPSIESDPTDEPAKVFFMNVPSGTYILKIFGTGEGAYTIKMRSIEKDAIIDLNPITGTASLGSVETHRIQISQTGQVTLSTTNQPPVANAGADQTVLTGDTVTLAGSGSYDPDGDPLKYTWEIISKPVGSIATLSNPETKTPSFVSDIAGQYIIQLTVSDFFVNSSSLDTVTVTAIEPTYIDLSLRALRAPSRMVLGDTKEVTAVVKNLSSVDANFKVTLEDVTEGKIIGTATGIEGAGRGGTRVKISYTPTTSGTHTLKATVTVTNPFSRDPNMGNNTLTDTTLVVVR